MSNKDDYTPKTLAEKAGMSRQYIARLCSQGRIPAEKHSLFGGWVIRRDDGDAWLRSQGIRTNNK